MVHLCSLAMIPPFKAEVNKEICKSISVHVEKRAPMTHDRDERAHRLARI